MTSEISQKIEQSKTISDEIRMRLALPAVAIARQNLPHPAVAATRSAPELSRHIDHTLLKPETTRADIQRVCSEAREHGFATVCVNSMWIPLASELLRDSGTHPIAVVGFPLGAALTEAKSTETRLAIAAGAREIDMVVAIGALKAREFEYVFKDIAAVVEAAHPYPVKVIVETSLLTLDDKIAACCLSQSAGAAFVKTSTGFGGGGATTEDILLMRAVVGPEMGIKASGGIRNRADADRLLAAGADRLGASASVAIVGAAADAPGAGNY